MVGDEVCFGLPLFPLELRSGDAGLPLSHIERAKRVITLNSTA